MKENYDDKNGQDIPYGYQKTEAGIIPIDWDCVTLGSLGSFTKGKEVSLSATQDHGLPAVMYGDIYVKYNTYFSKANHFINQEIAKKSTPVTKGDLLFTGSGETAEEIGKCVCFLGDETIYIGGDILAFHQETFDNLFLAYQQNSYQQIKQKTRMAQGYSVVHIYERHLSALDIAIPPLPEQQKIAEILSTQDEVIKKTEELIAALEKRKLGLMQKLLSGVYPFPKNSMAWCELKVEDLVIDLVSGGTPSTNIARYWNGRIPWVSSSDFYYHTLKPITRFITEEGLSNCAAKKVNANIVLLVTRVGVGKVAISPSDLTFSQDITALINHQDLITSKFLYWALIYNSHQFTIFNQGTSISGITLVDLNRITILVPLIETQQKITEILDNCSQEIVFQKEKLNKNLLQKQALMQQLITGKIRTFKPETGG